MPLLKFHLCRGRSAEELDKLLGTTHRVMVTTFKVPQADRYQLVSEYEPSHIRIEDTGLGLPRSNKFVLLEVLSRPRGADAKVAFYRDLSIALSQECDVSSADLMVSFVENTDEDWSFGNGRAQFLTGEL